MKRRAKLRMDEATAVVLGTPNRALLFMHNHPVLCGVVILAAFLLPVWYLTGEWSPLP